MTTTSFIRQLGVTLSLAMLIGASAAQADERTIWMRFAGALLQNVEQTDLGTKSAVYVRAWGNLGRADITGLTLEVAAPLPPAPDPLCPANSGKLADIVENNIVLTFTDLSLLYGNGSGAICVSYVTGEVFAVIDGDWGGGTQRFRNASGDWSIRFDEAQARAMAARQRACAASHLPTATTSSGWRSCRPARRF